MPVHCCWQKLGLWCGVVPDVGFVTEQALCANVLLGRDVMMAENMQNGMVRLKEGGEGPGLFPVLQPKGNPYAEAHPTGDAWLQSMWKEGATIAFHSLLQVLLNLPQLHTLLLYSVHDSCS